MTCPDLETLGLVHDGEASGAAVAAHVAGCPDCQRTLDRLGAIDRFVASDLGRATDGPALAGLAPRRRVGRWRPVLAAAGLLVAASVGLLRPPATPVERPVEPVAVGGPVAFDLPDGSRVEADAGAVVGFVGPSGRQVVLESGRITCRVVDDPEPFLVHTPAARVRALGTVFNVHVERDPMLVKGISVAGSAAMAVVTVAVLQGSVLVVSPAGEEVVEAPGSVRVAVGAPDRPVDRADPVADPALDQRLADLEAERDRLAAETYRLHVEYHERVEDARYARLVRILDRMAALTAAAEERPAGERFANAMTTPGAAEIFGEIAALDAEAVELLLFEIESPASPRRAMALGLAGFGLRMVEVPEATRRAWNRRLLAVVGDRSDEVEIRVDALLVLDPELLEGAERRGLAVHLEPEEDSRLRLAAAAFFGQAPLDPVVRERLALLAEFEVDPELRTAFESAVAAIDRGE